MSDMSPTPEGAFGPRGNQAKADRGRYADDPELVSVEAKRPPSAAGRIIVTVLIAAVVAGIVSTLISIGINLLMAMPSSDRAGRFKQEGKVTVGQNGPRQVFYAEPFAGPPKLELESPNMVFITLKEQTKDHFTIECRIPTTEVHWRAEGMRVK